MMKQKLLDNGWEMFYECNCPGGKKQYYSNTSYPGFVVKIKVKTQMFIIIQNNMVVAGPFNAYLFDQKMKEYNLV